MESPFTGGKVTMHFEPKHVEFRKDIFEINQLYYKCADTKEEFTTDELDQVNVNQLYNQYRVKYGLPFPEEIKEIREQYELSASKMSEILGLGINSYRQYESGDIPTVANGRLILAAKDPEEFIKFLDASKPLLGEKEYLKFRKTAQSIIVKRTENPWNISFSERIFNRYNNPSEFNGYKKPNEFKVSQMIGYFSQSINDLYKTKLNKLLFFSDFLCYKKTGYSISGIAYRAIQKGPVPAEYGKLYIKLVDDKLVQLEFVDFDAGYYGEALRSKTFNHDDFTKKELESMNDVRLKFGEKTTNEIVEISHQEKAWVDNIDDHSIISYSKYAFGLEQV